MHSRVVIAVTLLTLCVALLSALPLATHAQRVPRNAVPETAAQQNEDQIKPAERDEEFQGQSAV